MNQKFVVHLSGLKTKFLVLNHTSNMMLRVTLLMLEFAPEREAMICELKKQVTSGRINNVPLI